MHMIIFSVHSPCNEIFTRLLLTHVSLHYTYIIIYSCGTVEFSLVDTQAYTHLLFVGFILKLYQGNYREALVVGKFPVVLLRLACFNL